MRKHGMVLLLCSLLGMGVFAGETPAWLEGWSFGGDLRLRYEGTRFDADDKKTRNRGRFRLRLGAKKEVLDNLTFGLRLASGGGQATSTNQSFDNSFSGKDLYIDRAFLTYKVNDWTLGGGKVKNPFHTTNVVWDNDVNQEGLFQKYDNKSFYAVFGQMLVEEERNSQDTNLLAGQLGYKKKDRFDVSAAFYSYQGVTAGDGDIDYQFVEGVGDAHLGPGVLRLTYVKNTSSEIMDEDTAYGVFYNFKQGAFSFNLKYARVELNSAFPQFSDSDFGFSDVEGFAASGTYKVNKYVSWRLTVFSVDGIVDEAGGFDRADFDLNLKF